MSRAIQQTGFCKAGSSRPACEQTEAYRQTEPPTLTVQLLLIFLLDIDFYVSIECVCAGVFGIGAREDTVAGFRAPDL